MTTLPILSILTFLPLIGAIFIALLVPSNGGSDNCNTKYAALFTTLFTLGLSLFLLVDFDKSIAGYQFVEQFDWIEGYNISYHLGIDSISLSLILLTTILLPICILASWVSVKKRIKEYMICFLALESFIIGVFCSLDFVMFYIFFEVMLIPMYLLIGIWGG